ncbi:MAG: biotin transporter BioY [Anaerolineae bacterium]
MYAKATISNRIEAFCREAGPSIFFAALTALGARIAIRLPFSPVPVTLQVLVVLMSGLALGSRRGFIAQLGYLTAGMLGAPVFAGGTGGPAVFLGPTGGYLMAFPVAAWVAGRLGAILWIHGLGLLAAALAALAVIYGGGGLWLTIWLQATQLGSFETALVGAWHLGVRPFILVDLVKAFLATAAVGGSQTLWRKWLEPEL